MTKIEVEAGENIFSVTKRAIRHSRLTGQKAEFVFNDIPMLVDKNSFIDDILTIYHLKSQIRTLELNR